MPGNDLSGQANRQAISRGPRFFIASPRLKFPSTSIARATNTPSRHAELLDPIGLNMRSTSNPALRPCIYPRQQRADLPREIPPSSQAHHSEKNLDDNLHHVRAALRLGFIHIESGELISPPRIVEEGIKCALRVM